MTSKRLLVIDDEVDFANLVARVGRAMDFEVEVTTSGRDFKEAVPRFRPDIIVLDIIMPEIDGIELINWLAQRGTAARVIVATGYNPSYAKMAQVLGTAHGIISVKTLLKPVALADLQAALRAAAQP
jgi:CheY-like chemotaxis protein